MAVSLAAKIQVIEGMEAGGSWQAALHTVGVQASESTVYLWRQKWRQGGPAALSDGRHGRRHKMNEEIRAWLQGYCAAAPDRSSRQVQAALLQPVGVVVSRGHINLLRTQGGVSRPPKKGSD
ncbi:MAG TPA: helix-turn-helix domain containing protein [Caldilineaceae bacterium]|nr:helix-turn-helix domain containing protein [Caldilineaceae bacterium]